MSLDLKSYAATVRVTDGAWGTQLQKQGLPPGSSPELWNVQNPSAVEAVARSYVQAGADVILTNTFGANRFVLSAHGLSPRVAELAEAGVRISRRVAEALKAPGRQVKVFASLGPTGKIVMMEEASKEDLAGAFAESAEALAWGGADAIVLETFNELAEAEIALKAAKKATDLPVVVSLTFASGPDKTRTMMGDSPEQLAAMAEANGAAAVGANCGVGPENYIAVARMLRAATKLPIWIKANAGLPIVGKDGKTVFPMKPKPFAAYVPKLIAAGASFIGGCCGTTPAHVEAVRAAVDKA
jgi:methionine synthase I (cobalamin-dependent)